MRATRTFSEALGLIVLLLAVCQPQVSDAQFFPQQNAGIRQVPRQGSVSRATSNAREREVDLGPIGFTSGVSNSRAVTKQNGGQRNGGLTSVARSKAISRELNLGPLDIGSTLTSTKTRTNGAVSRSLSNDLNIGPLGIESSLSRDNLRNGIGLQRDPNGGVSLGLGLLNIDLNPNAQQTNALTQAQVNAQGRNARARANSNAVTRSQQFGGIGITDTNSRSTAVGRTQQGRTTALTGGLGGGAATNALSHGRPVRRASRSAPVYKTAPVQRAVSRPKRRAQYIPFAFPDNYAEAPRHRRQFSRRPPGAIYFPSDRESNANSQGIASNKGNRFEQQAGANTHSNNRVTHDGLFQDTGASSIGSNLENDGSSGQVSSANVAQMNEQTASGQLSSNNAQSQSLNFDPNQQQAAAANAGTKHNRNENGERVEATGGSQSTNNNQFGTATNIANTNSAVFREGNQEGSKSDASSQSIFQGANNQNANANTNANTESKRGPGFVSNSASSNANAVSQGGRGANANASASASSSASSGGRGGSNSITNANAGADGGAGDGFGGAQANSATNSGFPGFGGFGGFGRG